MKIIYLKSYQITRFGSFIQKKNIDFVTFKNAVRFVFVLFDADKLMTRKFYTNF